MKVRKVLLTLFYLVLAVHNTRGIEDSHLNFPEGFWIGSASAAYQVEGAWNASDKCESNWDYFVHHYPEKIADHSNADVSCDAYNHYKEDIQMMKKIGMDFYRFSISWPRILPTGFTNSVSTSGLKYYHDLLDELEKNGIMPIVTIYHWDHPQRFENEFGGWLSEKMAYLYASYAEVIFKEFAHRVKIFATVNEPHIFCRSAYETGTYPHVMSQDTKGWGYYHCIQNILKGNALVYHAYQRDYKKLYNGKLGLVLPITYNFGKDPGDKESEDIAFDFQAGITAHPIFSKDGDWPAVVKQKVAERSKAQGLQKSRLPEFSQNWIKYIKGTADYFGLNHYSSDLVEPISNTDMLSWPNDEGLQHTTNSSWATAESPWLKVVPEGFSATLRAIKAKYNNPEVYVMENGVSDGNGTKDDSRIEFMRSYMKEMLTAIHRDGCNVKSYSIWSFLDSFEWDAGFTQRFGLMEVDFKDPGRKRTPKKSVEWLKKVIQARKLLL